MFTLDIDDGEVDISIKTKDINTSIYFTFNHDMMHKHCNDGMYLRVYDYRSSSTLIEIEVDSHCMNLKMESYSFNTQYKINVTKEQQMEMMNILAKIIKEEYKYNEYKYNVDYYNQPKNLYCDICL